MKTTTTTTFEVSDVKLATEPLPEVHYKEAIEALLTKGGINDDEDEWEDEPGRARPETPSPRRIEACSRYHGRLLGGSAFHPVMVAVHRSFTGHRPLILSPDIDLADDHARPSPTTSTPTPRSCGRGSSATRARSSIDVRRDDFVKGSPENPWPEVFGEFSAKVREHVGPAIDLFLPAFSTTGPAERAAAEVVLLDAMRSYFRVRAADSLCGIPAITLEGTTEDWQALAERAGAFAEFGLGGVDRLAAADPHGSSSGPRRGTWTRPFWRSLYKQRGQERRRRRSPAGSWPSSRT